jgi:hypothetical protein
MSAIIIGIAIGWGLCACVVPYFKHFELTEPPKRVNELPELPDDDADFTPDLARKIIAKYQEMLARRQS